MYMDRIFNERLIKFQNKMKQTKKRKDIFHLRYQISLLLLLLLIEIFLCKYHHYHDGRDD